MTETFTKSQKQIAEACDEIKTLLLEKNLKYGDAALNPTRIMSTASTVEQLLVRIDDKLNRIKKGAGLLATDEDVVKDLCGYFILLKIALENEKPSFEWIDGPEPELDIEPGSDWNFKTQTVPFGTTGANVVGVDQIPTRDKLPEDSLPYFVNN